MRVLVSGGLGYIGSHTCLALIQAGHEVTLLDNLSHSRPETLARIEGLAGRAIAFHRADVRDRARLETILADRRYDAVVHLAGVKAVARSQAQPLETYENNVSGTLTLLLAMQAHGVKRLVFSSSAALYGPEAAAPFREDMPIGRRLTPYARSKAMIERVLGDLCAADEDFRAISLRYFNAVGAHPSGRLGESAGRADSSLGAALLRAASGIEPLRVYGADYDTPDGTAIRDFVHVWDLARGHAAALTALERGAPPRGMPSFRAVNLGIGRGESVYSALRAFEDVLGRSLPVEIHPRRAGDIAVAVADPGRAARELDWTARYDLRRACADAWRWWTEGGGACESGY